MVMLISLPCGAEDDHGRAPRLWKTKIDPRAKETVHTIMREKVGRTQEPRMLYFVDRTFQGQPHKKKLLSNLSVVLQP